MLQTILLNYQCYGSIDTSDLDYTGTNSEIRRENERKQLEEFERQLIEKEREMKEREKRNEEEKKKIEKERRKMEEEILKRCEEIRKEKERIEEEARKRKIEIDILDKKIDSWGGVAKEGGYSALSGALLAFGGIGLFSLCPPLAFSFFVGGYFIGGVGFSCMALGGLGALVNKIEKELK